MMRCLSIWWINNILISTDGYGFHSSFLSFIILLINFFIWNCKGLAGKLFPLAYKKFANIHKSDMVMIVKPRISDGKALGVIA